jgi:hypothetical protein
MEYKMKPVFQLTCEDASNLGGPMGSEYTTTLWTELFTEREKAVKYAVDWCKKRKCDKHIIKAAKELQVKDSVDAYAYLFSISKRIPK